MIIKKIHFNKDQNGILSRTFRAFSGEDNLKKIEATKMLYNCGQNSYQESRFGFFSRRKLERQIIYGDQPQKPFFLVAYKIFVDALANKDIKTLQSMTEKTLMQKVKDDYKFLDEMNFNYVQVQPSKMQMGCTLIDTKQIQGAYIDRTKNQVERIVCKFDRSDRTAYYRPMSSSADASAAK